MSRSRDTADLFSDLPSNWVQASSVPNLAVQSFSSPNLDIGWYTIAINPGNRSAAKMILAEQRSSRHQTVTFYAGWTYAGDTFGPSRLQVVYDQSYGSGGSFRYIRMLEGGLYDGVMLQVYLDTNCAFQFYIYENIQEQGWFIRDYIPNGTDPGGLNNYAALTNVYRQVDLDTI